MSNSDRTIFQYNLWGQRILSDLDLGEVESACETPGPSDALHLELVKTRDWDLAEGEFLFEDRLPDGDLWVECRRSGSDYIARFPQACEYLIQPGSARILCAPLPDADPSSLTHITLDHVIPRYLSLKEGYLVLHGCAVQMEGHVVAILGKSGRGKSTLAAWLAKQGFPLLTDDCLVLRWEEKAQQWMAHPSYQSVRLWPDSVNALGIDRSTLREFAYYSAKKRTGRDLNLRFASGGFPLGSILNMPEPAEGEPAYCGPPVLRRLRPGEAFFALANSLFRLDVTAAERNRRELDALAGLTNAAPFWSLLYERNYEQLPEVQKAIIEAAIERERA
jgi:hypothetical protein